jgi:hypothetical protein
MKKLNYGTLISQKVTPQWAEEHRVEVDTFVIYTVIGDFSQIHPLTNR